ncbi:hypothetical protein [Pelomonas cellulosilytica]|uniref:Transmembrane protein n=1 Tax=Pelomonas cellulosilytica TaxID=2906762 RepID=A0ABS8Y0R4_9BURK|nr:hypothetical protein [Pelomonas sp. P8]MCE4557191.1 hypothetical protein [Pelomonas sp. P8]MCE4557193.1 hypothetical protein [Pelomonas sp. P8]
MSPTFFTSVAGRFYARRRWLFGASLLAIAILFAALSTAPPQLAFLASILAGPAIAVPWTLLCACVWFHPQRGNLQPRSKLIGRLPPLVQTGVRWYAAVFLALFLFFGALVLPVLSVAWL